MAAKKGNKTAEKWTREQVIPLLAKIEKEAEKASCLYIGTALVAVKLYKEIWSYWKDKFKDDDDVFQPIKRIEQMFEAKLFAGGLKGELNPTTVIFGLKNNHDWKDKRETEHSGEMTVQQITGMVVK